MWQWQHCSPHSAEIKKLGRVSLIDLADIVGVDLYHVEKQAQLVVSDDPGLMLIQGEVISNSYWDNVVEDVNERLQESSLWLMLFRLFVAEHFSSLLTMQVRLTFISSLVASSSLC
ncbi:hypothetical protein Droror1_Dr00013109 [Drosera rotundifolia]